MSNPSVALIMGSDSDWPIMQDAAHILDEFSIPYIAQVISAHRTPTEMIQFGKTAAIEGIKIIIAGAGGAARLCRA